jgi:hypothetical protein
MNLAMYSVVRLSTDKYRSKGVFAGDVGVIVEIWGEGAAYEIDFSDSEGTTIAQFAVPADELVPI